MTITTDLVEAYLKCPTKCCLLSREEVESGKAYAEWTRTKRASFRSEGIQRLVTRVVPEKCNTRSPGWQLAIDFKACSNNLQASCHAVERIPSSGRGEAESSFPFDSCFARSSLAATSSLSDMHIFRSGTSRAG